MEINDGVCCGAHVRLVHATHVVVHVCALRLCHRSQGNNGAQRSTADLGTPWLNT